MNPESIGFKNLALYLKQLQDTGNDRRVTPIAEEISKEEFESYIKKETNLALRECSLSGFKPQVEILSNSLRE